MKRVVLYTALFVVGLLLMALAISSLGWLFRLGLVVFSFSCALMERNYKMLHGELDEMFGIDDELK